MNTLSVRDHDRAKFYAPKRTKPWQGTSKAHFRMCLIDNPRSWHPIRGQITMPLAPQARRTFLVSSAVTVGSALTPGACDLRAPLRAQSFAPTASMRGGDNNYRPGAPIVSRIGGGGFLLTGTVRRAGDGAPLPRVRIQVWAHTTEGHERDAHSHGAMLTDANGVFRMEMPQIVPAFGQAHAHLAYDAAHDENGFQTVFLRPVLRSARDTSLSADFVLQRA